MLEGSSRIVLSYVGLRHASFELEDWLMATQASYLLSLVCQEQRKGRRLPVTTALTSMPPHPEDEQAHSLAWVTLA